eukprot:GHVQ01023305.1.p1 GENE.GHVQ01023305.1~~GHVQ01023305.1.p1  ORF type:complete len:1528 (-),score=182.97 GHVQ01023305.1:594-5177(-)
MILSTTQQKSMIYDVYDGKEKKLVSVSLGGSRAHEMTELHITTDFGVGCPLFLHWGVCFTEGTDWQIPSAELIPEGSTVTEASSSVRTPFLSSTSKQKLILPLPKESIMPLGIQFVLYQPPNRWIKPGSHNFYFPVKSFISDMLMSATHDVLLMRKPELYRMFDMPRRTAKLYVFIWTRNEAAEMEVLTNLQEDVALHWGVVNREGDDWLLPDERFRPPNTTEASPTPFGGGSLQTPFLRDTYGSSVQYVRLRFPYEISPKAVGFVLKVQHTNEWIKYLERDFYVEIPYSQSYKKHLSQKQELDERRHSTLIKQWQQDCQMDAESAAEPMFMTSCNLNVTGGRVTALAYDESSKTIRVKISATVTVPCVLHWGIVGDQSLKPEKWAVPPKSCWPEGTKNSDSISVDSPMRLAPTTGVQEIELILPKIVTVEGDTTGIPSAMLDRNGVRLGGVFFVLREIDGSRWFHASSGGDMFIQTSKVVPPAIWKVSMKPLVDSIVRAELSQEHPWSLPHRYRHLQDLLSNGSIDKHDPDFWAWIYVWIKFAKLRSVEWQRHCTTNMEELCNLSEHLSLSLMNYWRQAVKCRPIIRLVFSLFSRTSGVHVADDIKLSLQRCAILSQPFFQQWVEKLTLNPTPDDLTISRALVAFAATNFDASEFWLVMHETGLRKQELANWEPAITAEPTMLQNVTEEHATRILKEFREALRILQSAYEAVDLKAALRFARQGLSRELQSYLDDIVTHLHSNDVAQFQRISDARSCIYPLLTNCNDNYAVRDFMCIDIALDALQQPMFQAILKEGRVADFSPVSGGPSADSSSSPDAAEVSEQCALRFPGLYAFKAHLGSLLTGVMISHPWNEEMASIHSDWYALRLPHMDGFQQRPPLLRSQPKAVDNLSNSAQFILSLSERVHRCIGKLTDTCVDNFADKVKYLGECIGVSAQLKKEFVSKMLRDSVIHSTVELLHYIRSDLRSLCTEITWTILGGAERKQGQLFYLDNLSDITSVQSPSVIVARHANGSEVLPDATVGLLLCGNIDGATMLSSVCLQARALGALTAVCLDVELFEGLKQLHGQWVRLSMNYHMSFISIRLSNSSNVPKTASLSTQLSEADASREERLAGTSNITGGCGANGTVPVEIGSLQDPLELPLRVFPLLPPLFRCGGSTRPHVAEKDGHGSCTGESDGTSWVLSPKAFTPTTVGQKCIGIARLMKCDRSVAVDTATLAVTFDAFDRTLNREENIRTAASLQKLVTELESEDVSDLVIGPPLKEARGLVRSLVVPRELLNQLRALSMSEGPFTLDDALTSAEVRVCMSIKNVWCSLYTPSMWMALKNAGLSHSQIRACVLIQQAHPQDYSFKMRTSCPVFSPSGKTNLTQSALARRSVILPPVSAVDPQNGSEPHGLDSSQSSLHDRSTVRPEMTNGNNLIGDDIPTGNGYMEDCQQEVYGEVEPGISTGRAEVLQGGLRQQGRPLAFRASLLKGADGVIAGEPWVQWFPSKSSMLACRLSAVTFRPDLNVEGLDRFMTSGYYCTCTI